MAFYPILTKDRIKCHMYFKTLCNKLLFGKYFFQEYICAPYIDFIDTHVYINTGNRHIDVSGTHLFLGYKPVIIGLPVADNFGDKLKLEFYCDKKPGKLLGFINMQSIHTLCNQLKLYRATSGGTELLPAIQKEISNLYSNRKADKKHELYLPEEEYEQVRAAYIFPRKIKLVVVGKDGLYNVFPTDLHGALHNDKYAISLRATGKANKQLAEADRILLCEMDVSTYKKVYTLGKNHMQDFKPKEKFNFGSEVAQTFNLPVCEGAVSCSELAFLQSHEEDVHNINLLKVVNTQTLSDGPILCHVHERYASWRIKENIAFRAFVR